ncbi:MAG: type II toxin-antitoxin system ParD family antitoxin [Pseudomonadota bacterium]
MSTNVHLTPELERFTRDCVDSGRYNNVSEVVRAALRLLEEREERRRKFDAMLDDVEAEVGREGTISHEAVMAELDRIIDAAEDEKN